MFKSLFGSQKSGSTIPDPVMIALQEYRSDIFLQGVIAVTLKSHYEKRLDGAHLSLTLPFCCASEDIVIQDYLRERAGIDLTLDFRAQIASSRQQTQSVNNVRNIIAIASGKGGVGKSTCTVNIARALQQEGASVGILDADIYGPSIPLMLGCANKKPDSIDGKSMQPIDTDGIATMSLGYLIEPKDAAVWRGPMASSALLQLLNETDWPELDYLLIDMPPGTGDIQLTLTQKVPVTAAIVVTTPQNIALADAVKGISMFEKVQVPVLGIVENMSYFECSQCGANEFIFGQGGGEQIADDYAVPLLGQVPLTSRIREAMDTGEVGDLLQSASTIGDSYRTIAKKLSSSLYYQWDKYAPTVAEIVITDD